MVTRRRLLVCLIVIAVSLWLRYRGAPLDSFGVSSRRVAVAARAMLSTLTHLPRIPEELLSRDREISTLLVAESERAELVRENVALRQLLSVPERSRADRLIGEIIGATPGSFGTQLLVRLPADRTVSESSPVFVAGAAFGRVTQMSEGRVVVEPLFSPRTAIAVTVGEQGGVGLLRGENGAVVVDDISATFVIAVGDVIRVASGDATFPQGTVIGRVRLIESPDGAFVKRAVVDLVNLPQAVDFVELIPAA